MSERDGRGSPAMETWYNPGSAVVFSARQEIRDDLALHYCPYGVVRHVRSRDELRGVSCSLVVMDSATADDPMNLVVARVAARIGDRPDRSRQH